MSHEPVNPVIPPEESLIQYPCAFPIKVMGVHTEAFEAAVIEIVTLHDQAFDQAQHLERRPSSSGKYLSLTVTVTAVSREQLDNIYRAFTSHELIKYVL